MIDGGLEANVISYPTLPYPNLPYVLDIYASPNGPWHCGEQIINTEDRSLVKTDRRSFDR